MSEQALKRILVVVAALVVAYGLAELVTGGTGGGGGDAGAVTSALEGLDAGSVSEAVFQRASDTVRLARSDGSWTVNGFAADSSRVAALWSSLEPDHVDGVVARNPDNHDRLGVGDGAPRAVFRTGDGRSTALLVGNSGPAFPSVYVRLEGSDEVVLLDGELRSAARRGVSDWRDRTIARVDTGSVTRVEVTRDGATSVLERADSGWNVAGEAASADAVRNLLGQLARLDASGFAPDSVSLDEPERRVVALGASGDTLLALDIQPTEDSGVRVRPRGRETIYRLSSYRADRLTPEAADLRGGAEGG